MVRVSYYKGFGLYDAKARDKEEALEILVKELSVSGARIASLNSRYLSIKQKNLSKTVDFDGMAEDMEFLAKVAGFFQVLCGVRYCADRLVGQAFRFLLDLPDSQIKQHFLSRSQGFEPLVICEEEAAKFSLIFAMGIKCLHASENLASLPMNLLLNTVIVAKSNGNQLDNFVTESTN